MVDFLILGIIILIELSIIVYLFDRIEDEFDSRNMEKPYKFSLLLKICEILIMIISIYFVTQFYLKKKFKQLTIDYISIFIVLFVIGLWVYINYIHPILNIDMGFNHSTNNYNVVYQNYNKNNKNSDNNTSKISKNNSVFSRYISQAKMNNFAFNNLYPKDINNQIDGISRADSVGDNSNNITSYDGYAEGDPCFGCKCINVPKNDALNKRQDYDFCGKDIPGVGVFGCSPKWKCNPCGKNYNCTDKETPDSKTDFTCDSCKCLDTPLGKICGMRDGNGYVHKCKNTCKKCKSCGTPHTKKFPEKYKTLDADSSLNKVKVSNISKELLNNVIN